MIDLNPVKTDACNFVFSAPPSMPECKDLDVYRDDERITSFWHVPFLSRLRFVFTGKIQLTIWGNGMPPVGISL